jgi:site-specific DNA recombinase
MVHCGRCERKFYGVPIHGKPYYRCSGRIKLLTDKPCDNPTINAQWLETAVWSEVEAVLRDPKLITTELERRKNESYQEDFIKSELSKVSNRLTALDREQEQLLQWALKGFPEDTIIKENEKINRERTDLKKRRVELENMIKDIKEAEIDLERVEKFCQLARENLANFTYREKRLALEELSIKVLVDGKTVTLEGVLPISEVNTASPHL